MSSASSSSIAATQGSSQGCAAKFVAGFKAFKTGIFGSFYVLSKKMPVESKRARVIGQIITLLQLLSFLSAPNLRWSTLPSLQWLHWLSNLLSVQGFSFLDNNVAYLIVFYLAMAWAAVFCSLFAFTMAMFISGSFPVLWPLKVLRLIAGLTVDQLYIPVLSSLLTQFLCSSNPFWTQSGYSCFQGGHLAQTPIVITLIIIMTTLCAGFALLFYDAAVLSRSYAARVHGRLDFANLLIKTTLIVFVKTFPFATTIWGVVGLLLACGVLYLSLVLYLMPYLHHFSNRTDAAVASCFLYGAITVLLSQILPSLDAGVLLLVGTPLAAVFGVWAADWRANRVYLRPVPELSNAIEVELKCRYLLHEALFGHPTQVIHPVGEEAPPYLYAPGDAASAAAVSIFAGRGKPGDAEDGKLSSNGLPSSPGQAAVAIKDARGTTSFSSSSSLSSTLGGPGPTAMAVPSAEAQAKVKQEMAARLSDPDDSDAMLEMARQHLSAADIARIEGVYKAGVKRFKSDGLLHVALARWYLDLRKNKHLFMSSLLQAERGNGPLGIDIGFVVYNARKRSEDSSGSQGAMSAMLRVSFEKHLQDAKKQVVRAANAQLSFWTELLAPLPDLGRLHKASSDMSEAEAAAEQAFSQLLELSPQSLLVLRMYSEFTLRIRNNPEKSALLTAEAERIEESAAKEHSKDSNSSLKIMMESPLDVMSDSVGLIQISGNPHNLGTITAVNTVAARMLGYAKWQLLRRNINVIVPQPFSSWHDHFLRRFLASGEGNVLDYTRCLLAIHRNGHAFPLLVCVREVPSDQTTGGNTEFVGLLRPVATPEQHLMLDTDFKITAATAGSLQALDIEPSSLQQDAMLTDWVPELPRIIDELLSPKGTTIAFDSQHAKAMAAARISAANQGGAGGGQSTALLQGSAYRSLSQGQGGGFGGAGASTAATITMAMNAAYNSSAAVAASKKKGPKGTQGKNNASGALTGMPRHALLAEDDEDNASVDREFEDDLQGPVFRGTKSSALTRSRKGGYQGLPDYGDDGDSSPPSDAEDREDEDDEDRGPEIIWARASMQRVSLRSGLSVYIFYWQKLFLDPVTKAQAETSRREMLQSMVFTQQQQQQQVQFRGYLGGAASSSSAVANPLGLGKPRREISDSNHSGSASSSVTDERGRDRGKRIQKPRAAARSASSNGSAAEQDLSPRSQLLSVSGSSATGADERRPFRKTTSSSGMVDPSTARSVSLPPGIRTNKTSRNGGEAGGAAGAAGAGGGAAAGPIAIDNLLQSPSQRPPPHPSTHVFSGVKAEPALAMMPTTPGSSSDWAEALPPGHPPLPPGTVNQGMSPQEAMGRCPALLRTNVFGSATINTTSNPGDPRPGTSGAVFTSTSNLTGVMLAARDDSKENASNAVVSPRGGGTGTSVNVNSKIASAISSEGASASASSSASSSGTSFTASDAVPLVVSPSASFGPLQIHPHLPPPVNAVAAAAAVGSGGGNGSGSLDQFSGGSSSLRRSSNQHLSHISEGGSSLGDDSARALIPVPVVPVNHNPNGPTSILRRPSMQDRPAMVAAGLGSPVPGYAGSPTTAAAATSPNGPPPFAVTPRTLNRNNSAAVSAYGSGLSWMMAAMSSADGSSAQQGGGSGGYGGAGAGAGHGEHPVPPPQINTGGGDGQEDTTHTSNPNPLASNRSVGSRKSVARDESDKSSDSDLSTSRVSAVKRLLARLRRQLNDGVGSAELLPALKWLQTASIFVWVLAVALTTAVVAVGWTQYTIYSENLICASDSSQIIDASQRMGFAVREMTLINQGWVAPPNQVIPAGSPLATPALASLVAAFNGATNASSPLVSGAGIVVPGWLNLYGDLVAQTARFNNLLTILYDYAGHTGNTALYTAIDTPMTSFVTDPVTGELDEITTIVSLQEACLQFISEAKAVAALPPALVTPANPAVTFLLTHSLRGSPLQTALNSTMFELAGQATDSKSTVFVALTAIYASLSFLLLVCALAVLVPILFFVDAAKDQVVRHFTQLPRRVIEKLREGAEIQTRKVADEDDEEEEDDAGGNLNDEDDVDGNGGPNAIKIGVGDSDDDGLAMSGGFNSDSDPDGLGATDAGGNQEPFRSAGQTGAAIVPATRVGAQSQQKGEVVPGDKASGTDPAEGEDWEALFRQSSTSNKRRNTLAAGTISGSSSENSGSTGQLPGGYGMGVSSRRLIQAANSYGVHSRRNSGPAGKATGQSGAPSPAGSVSGKDLRTLTSGSLGSVGGAVPRGVGPDTPPRFTKSIKPLLSLMFKYVAPLLVLWVFFSILYFTSRNVLEVTAATSSLALAGNTRGILTADLTLQIRESLRTVGDPAAAEQIVSGTVQTAIDLNYFHRLLMFGGVAASAELADASKTAAVSTNLLSASTEVYANALLLGDACNALWSSVQASFPTQPAVTVASLNLPLTSVQAQSYTGSTALPGANITECSAMLAGAISHGGINSGLKELMRVASRYVSRRAAGASDPANALGQGNMTTLLLSSELPRSLGLPPPFWLLTNAYSQVSPQGNAYGGFVTTDPLTGDLDFVYQVRSWNGSTLAWNLTNEFYSLSADMASPAMWAVKEAGSKYLSAASYAIAQAYTDAGTSSIQVFIVFQIAFAVSFLFAYALFLLIVILPSIRKESDMIRKQRGLMLLLPPPVLRFSRDLRGLLVAIVSNGGAGTAAVGVGPTKS